MTRTKSLLKKQAFTRFVPQNSSGEGDGERITTAACPTQTEVGFDAPCQTSATFLRLTRAEVVKLTSRGNRVVPGAEGVLAGYDFPGKFRTTEVVGTRPMLVSGK